MSVGDGIMIQSGVILIQDDLKEPAMRQLRRCIMLDGPGRAAVPEGRHGEAWGQLGA